MSTPERAFLHDIASPLAVADARSRSLLRKLGEGAFAGDQKPLLEAMQKLVGDIEKITNKLRARREELVAEETATDASHTEAGK